MFLNGFNYLTHKALGSLILACACLASGATAEPLPKPNDLAAIAKVASQLRAPVFVAFTLKRCPHCNTARRDYWVPMNSSAKWRGKVVMIELELDGDPALRDFSGNVTTMRDFAKRYGVRSVPTVIVFDLQGEPVTTPLVGLASADFYALYLEQAIEAGLARTRATR